MDYGMAKRAFRDAPFIGDAGLIRALDGQVFLSVIDVLGHGEPAHQLAQVCVAYLDKHCRWAPAALMNGLHKHILGSRGVVASIGHVDEKTGIFKYSSVGDTTVRKIGAQNASGVSEPGIVGYRMRTPQERTMLLTDGDLLLLYTDGISSHFELPEELSPHTAAAETAARAVVARFGKPSDDALCIALRYRS